MTLYRCPTCHCNTMRSSPWTDQASELLPDDDITVLVALDDMEVWPAYHSAQGWLYVTGDPIESARVLYWMPMPQHPDTKEAA